MTNPYESPKSDVTTEANFKRSIWWKVYFFIITILGAFYEQLTSIDLRQGMTDIGFYLTMAFGWLISIPGYIALYLYSKPYKQPWSAA